MKVNIGDAVFDLVKGWGKIEQIYDDEDLFPLVVEFDFNNDGSEYLRFTSCGKSYSFEQRRLFTESEGKEIEAFLKQYNL